MRHTISMVASALLLVVYASSCSSEGVTGATGRGNDLFGRSPIGVTVDGDNVSGTGTVNFFRLEGGFWAIRGDNSRVYDPLNLAEEFHQENLAVRFTGKVRRDMASVHMVGDIIEITSIERRR